MVLQQIRDWFRGAELAAEEAPSIAPQPENHRLCFVVDDEESVRKLLSRIVTRAGLEVSGFADASTVLQALKTQHPGIIFLDVSLERSDAIEVIRGLGSVRFGGFVQLMSGRASKLLDDVKRIGERHELSMLAPLQKPFRLEQVAGVLKALDFGSPPAKVPLDEALHRNWVEFWYQPKIDLQKRVLVGAEALARVRHPDHGVLMPGSFIPGADEESLAKLAQQALLCVLRDWDLFNQTGVSMQLAVNMPVSALTSLPIAELVRQHRPSSLNWDGLLLEVTEDQILRDIPLAHEIATQLRIYNIALSLDDFGSGYSSLSRLQELPFAEIKLDQKFVRNCGTDETNAALCQLVIDLAHRVGSVAVAEGIENPSELQALHRMGCDRGQGYLFARPMPRDELVTALGQRLHKATAA